MKRAEKITLLNSLLTGTATPKQIADLRKSVEPIHLRMNIGDDDQDSTPNDPVYCIDVYSDGTTQCYDKYADGRIVPRNP